MNNLTAIFSTLGGACAVAAFVAALTAYLKAKATALHYHREACRAHEEHDDKLLLLHISLDNLAAALVELQTENTTLRNEGHAKDRRIAKLERDLSNALMLAEK